MQGKDESEKKDKDERIEEHGSILPRRRIRVSIYFFRGSNSQRLSCFNPFMRTVLDLQSVVKSIYWNRIRLKQDMFSLQKCRIHTLVNKTDDERLPAVFP